MGWGTGDFRGESHGFRGVGDDPNSWGLRAADSRSWDTWSTGRIQTLALSSFEESDGEQLPPPRSKTPEDETDVSPPSSGPCFVYRGAPQRWRPQGKEPQQQPPESGRALASGDILGCAMDMATHRCVFFLMRRPRLLEEFEQVCLRSYIFFLF